tara:strand:+ start:6451 stop:7017 length:567 start_codon:yes stop_codon:yes gene_type:complete
VVTCAVLGDTTDRQDREISDHLADLTRLTGIGFVEVDPENAKLIAIVTSDAFERAVDIHAEHYRRFFDSDEAMVEETVVMHELALCYAIIETDPVTRVLSGAMVLIPTQIDRFMVRSCIVEEFTQIMGPVNDPDEIKQSIFNDRRGNLLLSDHDEMILRILYDERLKPGMTWDDAEPYVREILAELRS